MAGSPRVSVCIPTCNGERFVGEALESVLAQTFDDFELLVVDDASADGTLRIVSACTDPRLRVHRNEERLGIAGNWNRCLELAHAEYFCLFHQDDVMAAENLGQKIRILESDPSVGFVHSSVEFVSEPNAPPGSGDWVEDSIDSFVADGSAYFRKLILSGNRVCAPAVIARRRAVTELGGFNKDLGFALDYELWLKVCVSWRVAFINRRLVRYRWHESNASHAYRLDRGLDDMLAAAISALAFYSEKGAGPIESQLLNEAVVALDRQRRWAAELEKGKNWLDEQYKNWKRLAEERDRRLTEAVAAFEEQRRWAAELQEAKNWLDEQYTNWKSIAEQREGIIADAVATLDDQQRWLTSLEEARKELSEHCASWKSAAEQREVQISTLRRQIDALGGKNSPTEPAHDPPK